MEEQGNENQEYPKQEVPRWQNQGMDNIPSFSPPENEYGAPQQRGGKFGSIGTIVITVIISLVLCYAMVSLLGISPSMKQYKADITRLELDLVDIRTVNDGQATNIGNLAGAVATANSAATKAQSALDLSNSIKTGYDAILADVTALQAALENINTNGTGDVYDDAEIRGLITALQGDITTINADITALQAYDTTNTANLASISASITALQTSLSNLTTIVNNINGGEVDLSDILDDIDDINDEIVSLNTDITNLQDYDNYLLGLINSLQTQVTSLQSDKAIITSTSWVAAKTYQVNCKVNTTGNFAIIFTIYGNSVDTITINPMVGYVFTGSQKDYAYGGTPKTMRTFILMPDSTKVSGSTTALPENWVVGQTFYIQLVISTTETIDCIDIDTAAR